MEDSELRLECLKLAVQLVSPTVSDRLDSVVETAMTLYNHCNPAVDTSAEADKPRRGKPPKPRAEQ